MKAYRIPLASLLLLLVAAFAFAGTGDKAPTTNAAPKVDSAKTSSIAWLRYDEGLKKATAENKYLLVDITASWCGWCKKMDKETFADTTIINMINDRYVPVKLWGDSDNLLDINGYKISEKDLVQTKFGATGYPTFVFMCSDSIGIAKMPGYRAPADFQKLLTAVNGFSCDSIRTVLKEQQKK